MAKLFKFLRKSKEDVRTMSDMYEEMFEEMNLLVDKCFEATGMTVSDALADMDEQSGAVIGACMQSSKKLMGIASEQARFFDNIKDAQDQTNRKLLEQDKKLEEILRILQKAKA